MESSIAPVLGLQGMLSKEASDLPSPPPAYSHQLRLDIPSSLAASNFPRCQPILIDRTSLASLVTSSQQQGMDADDGTCSDDPQQSSIAFRINTSVRVSSNDNYVCINETPAEHANAIARAVVHAIQENSSGQCGIPMIDEDGRPRPVRIEVDAGLEVHGQGNVVGNENFVTQVLRQKERQQVLRRRRDDEDDTSPTPPAKRRRSQ
ncbi:hypothetical protein C2857_005403 [Epichloe festucae Fl1]|uniref:Uncharacterized protein n=1 Tax=Epichloe festucae (strain Fl1) TaxID=877507 RepID=A0A7S9KSS1_EPIFF|nr:hypothetical protein C2857_005403 [Epichloe festucae Fl1]